MSTSGVMDIALQANINKERKMTYLELIEKIDSDNTGIAKGYDINFLQEEFCFRYKPKNMENLFSSDLKMFKEIEKALLETKQPLEGDFVEYDGKFARISSIHQDNVFQLSNKIGLYVSKRGYAQASGCTWDPDININSERLRINNLIPTTKTKKGSCWTFSEDIAGGGRGVYFEIDFKVWSLGNSTDKH